MTNENIQNSKLIKTDHEKEIDFLSLEKTNKNGNIDLFNLQDTEV